MATSYPGGLDDFAEITTQKQNQAVGGRDHRQMHNDLGDAVEAIQTELGTDPAGSSDTVKARIAAAESAISGKAATSHTHAQSDVTDLVTDLAGKASTSDLADEVEAREDADDALAADLRQLAAQLLIKDAVLHIDARDDETLTLDSGKVAKIVDKVTLRSFEQADAAKQPSLGSINGHQALEFDGTNDFLVSSAAFDLARPHTMFIVFKSDVASGYRALFSSRAETNGNYAFQPIQIYAGNFATWFELGSTKTHQTADTSVHVVSIIDNGTDTVTRFDNGSPSVASSMGYAFANKLRLGSRTVAGNEFWDGLLGELIIVPRPMLPAQAAQVVNDYIKPGWGLP